MDGVEELLGKCRWNKHCFRANVAKEEGIVRYGLNGSIKVAKAASNVLNNRDKEPELYDAIEAVAPEWWGDDTQITLNEDLTCQRHRDRANKDGYYGLVTSREEPYCSTMAPAWRARAYGIRSMGTYTTGTSPMKGRPNILYFCTGARESRSSTGYAQRWPGSGRRRGLG